MHRPEQKGLSLKTTLCAVWIMSEWIWPRLFPEMYHGPAALDGGELKRYWAWVRKKTRERKAVESRAQTTPEFLEDRSADGLLAEEQAELVQRVREAIERLPDGQRTVVALRHYEGFSLKDIAEVRGCALGTVKSTLHQAFRSLRKSLGAEFLERVATQPGS